MSHQDALQLDESLDAGDVSCAWLVWSRALADAYRFSGHRGLVLGRVVLCFALLGLVVIRFAKLGLLLLMLLMLLMSSCIATPLLLLCLT